MCDKRKIKKNNVKLILCGCHPLATSELMCSTMWSMYLTLFRFPVWARLWHLDIQRSKTARGGHLCYFWSDWKKVMSDFDLVILNIFSLNPCWEGGGFRGISVWAFLLTDRQIKSTYSHICLQTIRIRISCFCCETLCATVQRHAGLLADPNGL